MRRIIEKFIEILNNGYTTDMINFLRKNNKKLLKEKDNMIRFIIIIYRRGEYLENNKLRVILNWYLEKDNNDEEILNDLFNISVDKNFLDMIKNIYKKHFDDIYMNYDRLFNILIKDRLEILEYIIIKCYLEKDKEVLDYLKYYLSLIKSIKLNTIGYCYNNEIDCQIKIILLKYGEFRFFLENLIEKINNISHVI